MSKTLYLSGALIALCGMVMPIGARAESEPSCPAYHKLSLQEDFNSFSNNTTWWCETGYVRNQEAQKYRTDCVWAYDGNLVIRTQKFDSEIGSGSVVSNDGFRYGVYVVRAKLPCFLGCWPAIWSTGNAYQWPENGEIDMMEYYPKDGEAIHANVAWGSGTEWSAKWNSAHKNGIFTDDWKNSYHIWRMDYTDDWIKLYCDDELLNWTMLNNTINPRASYYQYSDINPYRDPNNKQNMRLNLAIGGINGGDYSGLSFPQDYLVDYVYVFEVDGTEFDNTKSTSKNLLYNSGFEYTGFQEEDWDGGGMDLGTVKLIKDNTHLPYWKISADKWSVFARVLNDTEQGNYLRLQRYQWNGYGDGCATYHIKGLTAGATYTLQAMYRFVCEQNGCNTTSHGFRIYQCDDNGYKTHIISNTFEEGDAAAWTAAKHTFKAPSANIAIEAYLSNPYKGDGHKNVYFDIDDVYLSEGTEGITDAGDVEVSLDIVNWDFESTGTQGSDYTTASDGFVTDRLASNINGWTINVKDGSTVSSADKTPATIESAKDHINASIGTDHTTYLHFQTSNTTGYNGILRAYQTINVVPGKKYRLGLDAATNLADVYPPVSEGRPAIIENGNYIGWLPCGALVYDGAVDADLENHPDGVMYIDCAGGGEEWKTYTSKSFVPETNTITIVLLMADYSDNPNIGYYNVDNIKITEYTGSEEGDDPTVEDAYYFCGTDYSDWAHLDEYKMTETVTPGVYSVHVSNVSGEFKIINNVQVNGAYTEEWSYPVGANGNMQYNTVYPAGNNIGGTDSQGRNNNCEMSYVGHDCTVLFDKNNSTIEVIDQFWFEDDEQTSWNPAKEGYKFTYIGNGLYTLHLDHLNSSDPFKITTGKWYSDGGTEFSANFTAMELDTWYDSPVNNNSGQDMKSQTNYTDVSIVLDAANLKVKLVSGVVTYVDSTSADRIVSVLGVYDISGRLVSRDLQSLDSNDHGIYIVRTNCGNYKIKK